MLWGKEGQRMKKYYVLYVLCLATFFYFWSFHQALAMLDNEASFVRSEDRFDRRCKDNRPYEEDVLRNARVLDTHRFGKNTVTLYDIDYPGGPAFYFRATNEKSEMLEGLTGNYRDRGDQALFDKYQKLNQQERRKYIHDLFLQYTKVDLGPVELPPTK